MRKIRLAEWAKANDLSYRTAWNWAKNGKIKEPIEITETGSIFIISDKDEESEVLKLVREIHGRVCGNE